MVLRTRLRLRRLRGVDEVVEADEEEPRVFEDPILP